MQSATAQMANVSADRVSVLLHSGRRLDEAVGPSTRGMQAGEVIVDYLIAMLDTEKAEAESIVTRMENLNLGEVSGIVDSRLSAAGITTMAPLATRVTSQIITQAPAGEQEESSAPTPKCGFWFAFTAALASRMQE